MVVHAQAVALRIAIAKKSRLQHLVGREADAWYHVGRVEGELLDFGKVVLGVAVEFEYAHVDQRVVAMWPDLGQVKRVQVVGGRVLFGHDLDFQVPARKIAAVDGAQQIGLVAFAVASDQFGGFGIGQVLNALLRDEVELDPEALVVRVEQAEGVAAKTVHVAVAARDTPVAHHDGDLVQRFGQQGPEVPVVLGAALVGARVALDGAVQVRELERVAQEEHRRVVAHQVPVAFFCVELHGKPTNVALGVGGPALAGHSGKAHRQGRFLANG